MPLPRAFDDLRTFFWQTSERSAGIPKKSCPVFPRGQRRSGRGNTKPILGILYHVCLLCQDSPFGVGGVGPDVVVGLPDGVLVRRGLHVVLQERMID